VYNSIQPSAQCKSQPVTGTKNPTRRDQLTVSERARRLAELRAALTAPTFQARLRVGEQGEQL
jgi:hypothetical protein